jgi:hypothetical protein
LACKPISTFFSTVSQGSSAKLWKTMAAPGFGPGDGDATLGDPAGGQRDQARWPRPGRSFIGPRTWAISGWAGDRGGVRRLPAAGEPRPEPGGLSRTLNVNPLLVLLAILFGTSIGEWLGGFFGGFVAR